MSISQDQMVLAAEYVLGTLDVVELDEAQHLIDTNPEFAAAVRDWERRLGELNVMVGSVEPPADTFDKIKARIGRTDQPAMTLPHRPGDASQLDMRLAGPDAPDAVPVQPRNDVVALSRMRSARRVSSVFALMAAAACALFVTSLIRPDLLPQQLRPKPQVVEVVRTVEKPVDRPNRFVAVLQRDSVSPAFILTVDIEARTMTVRRVAAEAQPDKSYELWLVSSRFAAPRSLGLVGDDEFTSAQLATFEPSTISDAVYAISLEPTGGSPTGQPTGPVLWTGKLVEALPPDGNR